MRRCCRRCAATAAAAACRRCAEAYYSYSLIIVAITLFSIVTNAVSTWQYRRRLAALAHYTCEVEVRWRWRWRTSC